MIVVNMPEPPNTPVKQPPGEGLEECAHLKGDSPFCSLSLLTAVGTPKGFKLNSRGQGQSFCARRPRIASPSTLPTPQGSNGTVPPGPGHLLTSLLPLVASRRAGLLMGFSVRGTMERANSFESHWSDRWPAQSQRRPGRYSSFSKVTRNVRRPVPGAKVKVSVWVL